MRWLQSALPKLLPHKATKLLMDFQKVRPTFNMTIQILSILTSRSILKLKMKNLNLAKKKRSLGRLLFWLKVLFFQHLIIHNLNKKDKSQRKLTQVSLKNLCLQFFSSYSLSVYLSSYIKVFCAIFHLFFCSL